MTMPYNVGQDYYQVLYEDAEKQPQAVDFPKLFFVAPQFYYGDYKSYPQNPRQVQIPTLGMRRPRPIPLRMPEVTARHIEARKHIMDAVERVSDVRNMELHRQKVRDACEANAVGYKGAREVPKYGASPEGLYSKAYTGDIESSPLPRLKSALKSGTSLWRRGETDRYSSDLGENRA